MDKQTTASNSEQYFEPNLKLEKDDQQAARRLASLYRQVYSLEERKLRLLRTIDDIRMNHPHIQKLPLPMIFQIR